VEGEVCDKIACRQLSFTSFTVTNKILFNEFYVSYELLSNSYEILEFRSKNTEVKPKDKKINIIVTNTLAYCIVSWVT